MSFSETSVSASEASVMRHSKSDPSQPAQISGLDWFVYQGDLRDSYQRPYIIKEVLDVVFRDFCIVK